MGIQEKTEREAHGPGAEQAAEGGAGAGQR